MLSQLRHLQEIKHKAIKVVFSSARYVSRLEPHGDSTTVRQPPPSLRRQRQIWNHGAPKSPSRHNLDQGRGAPGGYIGHSCRVVNCAGRNIRGYMAKYLAAANVKSGVTEHRNDDHTRCDSPSDWCLSSTFEKSSCSVGTSDLK